MNNRSQRDSYTEKGIKGNEKGRIGELLRMDELQCIHRSTYHSGR